jgi:hypothetical protein
MRGRIPSRLVGVALLVALAPWCLGCATEIRLQRSAVAVAGDGNGRLLVRVFENASERRRGVSTRRRVVTELYRVEGKSNRLVHQDSEARWSVSDLPPGDYMLQVNSWVDDQGNAQALPSKFKEAFVIRPNETAMADVVLSGGSKVWGKVAVWVAVGVAVLAVAMLSVRHEMESQHWLGGSFGH